MADQRNPWRCFLILLLLCTFGAFPVWAQGEADPDLDLEDSDLEAPESTAAEPDVNFGEIDDLLALDEEIMSDPGTYSYDPGARRDPFQSLLRQRDKTRKAEERPDGIPGLLIDEIQVEGIFMLDEGPVAQIQSSSQQTSFLLRPDDQLWDGDVVRITLNEIVFKQSVNDPTALKPFREVVKKLDPKG